MYCDGSGQLGSGGHTTIFDSLSALAMIPLVRESYWDNGLGVSRTLNVTYLEAANLGERVVVFCEVVSATVEMCLIKCTMSRKSDGRRLSVCEHGKVNLSASKI
jgi:acyl-coenzyme A thioesterase 13